MSQTEQAVAQVNAPVLVTGATGYIGGRLVPRLLEAGLSVRCLVRDCERLRGKEWFEDAEVAEADVLEPEGLTAALSGVTPLII